MGPILPLVPGRTYRIRCHRRAQLFLGATTFTTLVGVAVLGVFLGLVLLLDDLIDTQS